MHINYDTYEDRNKLVELMAENISFERGTIMNPKTEDITIDPSMAKEWMATSNINNRKLRPNIVNKYADAMLRKQWIYNAESIKFDKNGVLIDGQHRLQAVIKSNVPLFTQVTTGLSHEAFDTIDDGAPRRAADLIYRAGIKNANSVTSIAKAIVCTDRGYGIYHAVQMALVSKTDQIDFCLDNDVKLQEAHRLSKIANAGCPIVLSAWGIAIYLIDREYGSEIVEEFINGAVNGSPYPKDPRNTLRRWVIKTRQASSGQLSSVIQLAHLIKAFNYWMNGRTVIKYIDWSKEKPYPRIGDTVDPRAGLIA
jgi:hypothetical protein